MSKNVPVVDSKLRHIVKVPECIYNATGIIVNGRCQSYYGIFEYRPRKGNRYTQNHWRPSQFYFRIVKK